MFLDAAALWFAFSKSGGPAEVRAQVRPFAVGYLIATVVLTPMLIASGRANAAFAAERTGFGGPRATYLFIGCICLFAAVVMSAGLGTGVLTSLGWAPWKMVGFLFFIGITNIVMWKRSD